MFGCSNKNEELLNDRLEFINGTIEEFNMISLMHNEALFNKLSRDNRLKLDTIKELSDAVIKYLNNLKSDLIDSSGGYNEFGVMVNRNNFTHSVPYIQTTKYRNSLIKTINAFPLLITELGIFEAFPIIYNGTDDPYWSHFPNAKNKSAIELIFSEANVPSVLSSISRIQGRVLQYERRSGEKFLLDELDSLRAR